jgi:hypothetical protein
VSDVCLDFGLWQEFVLCYILVKDPYVYAEFLQMPDVRLASVPSLVQCCSGRAGVATVSYVCGVLYCWFL